MDYILQTILKLLVVLATELDPEILHKLTDKYPDIIKHMGQLKAEISKDGTAYCCLSASNPQAGLFVYGATEEEALEDWESLVEKE